jgi:hypothetical protein
LISPVPPLIVLLKMDLLKNPFILGAAIGMLVAVPIIAAAIIAWRKRCEKYQQFLTEDGYNGYNLRYCTRSRFQRWWKFFPWEGVGMLSFRGQDLVFDARSNNGDSFTVRTSVHGLLFHGRRNWFRNGLLPWLLLKSDSGDYYLCVETGPFIFGAGKRTRDLLASIKTRAEQENQANKPLHPTAGNAPV